MYLFFYFIYLLLISLAYELGLLEALFNYLFIIISHFVFTSKFKLIMNILNMCVLQCILCASERKLLRIYAALQINIIIIYYYYIIQTSLIA